jgi:hypothetical protein
MRSLNIAHQRLYNLHLAGTPLESPAAVVRRLGAVQAQDYGAAKWAVAQRTGGGTNAALDQALADGAILRTHVMRPTWHFVTPEDIRWLLALTAPRVKAALAYYDRRLELDDTSIGRSNAALAAALVGGRQLTRPELAAVLARAGFTAVGTDGQRLGHLLMHAELDGVICSGARRGNQFTYALLAERAPHGAVLAREEALAALAERYFTSHGPATVKDFAWWSGLTAADAGHGLELVKSHLIDALIDGRAYWFTPSPPPEKESVPTAYLLPNFDEYMVGYADRSAVYDARHTATLDGRPDILSHHTMVIDGQIVGTWKRSRTRGGVVLEPSPFTARNEAELLALRAAAERYAEFLKLPVHFPLPVSVHLPAGTGE